MDKNGLLLSLTDLSCGYADQPIVQQLNLHLNSGALAAYLVLPVAVRPPRCVRSLALNLIQKAQSLWRAK